MSYGLVPGPGTLLAEKRASAESKLGCTSALPSLPSPPPDHLYKWADEIMTQLRAGGCPNPKLTLAQSLDIPSDPRWLGCVGTHRNTPHHRVIARFARERLWDQIWSLNWDCVQESAFENVGIKREAVDAQLPWPTSFKALITAHDCAEMGEAHGVKILKPHGCVMALVRAKDAEKRGDRCCAMHLSERFLITESELKELQPRPGMDGTQHFIFANLSAKLCTQPCIVAGWSAGEKYLLDYFEQHVRPVLELRQLAVDELSIVDISFNHEGHVRLAGFYRKNEHTAHIPVDPTHFTSDSLFLWLQALYAVGCLITRASPSDKPALDGLAVELQQPPNVPSFVIEWADNFLPVWVRLCWRCGLIRCRNRAYQPVKVNDINLESRDEHIPWGLREIGIERPELTAAARFLAALQCSGNGGHWNYEMFPGGLYRDNLLVIPLPAWDGAILNDLQGLKALVNAIKEPGAGYIDKLGVAFLAPEPTIVIPDKAKLELKECLVSNLGMTRFARGDGIEEIKMEDL